MRDGLRWFDVVILLGSKLELANSVFTDLLGLNNYKICSPKLRVRAGFRSRQAGQLPRGLHKQLASTYFMKKIFCKEKCICERLILIILLIDHDVHTVYGCTPLAYSDSLYSQTPIKRTPLGPRLGVGLIGVSA